MRIQPTPVYWEATPWSRHLWPPDVVTGRTSHARTLWGGERARKVSFARPLTLSEGVHVLLARSEILRDVDEAANVVVSAVKREQRKTRRRTRIAAPVSTRRAS